MKHEPKMMVHGIPTFYGVYEYYKNEVMTYGARSWNNSTTRQYDGYVRNHIIPYLPNHDIMHIGMLTRQDYDAVMEAVRKRGKNSPGEPYEPWDENSVPEKVEYLIRAVVWTAQEHLLCTDIFGPRAINRKGYTGGTRTGEQVVRTKKSLSVTEEMAVFNYLLKHIDHSGTTVGLLLMFALGLRNNEACGMNFGHIREFTMYPDHYYVIVSQTTQLSSNILKVMGKTANSGRRIPLPDSLAKWILKLKSMRINEAMKRGYLGNGDDLPLVCKESKVCERCSADDLTRAAKTMFEAIGMRIEDLVALNQELLEEAQGAHDDMEEDEFRQIEAEPTAYLLRRNFATHLAILGLDDVEIRYLIGHRIDDEYVQRREFGDEKMMHRIIDKLSKRPLLNLLISEQRLSIETSRTETIVGCNKIVFNVPAEKISFFRINVTAREPGDEIRIRVVNSSVEGTMEGKVIVSSVNNQSIHMHNRTINGLRFYYDGYESICDVN